MVARDTIECPGDIIRYACAVRSNSESVQLTWSVTIPGQTPINATLFGSENKTTLNSFITVSVTRFMSNMFIDSVLEITVQLGIPNNQIMLECLTENLGNFTTLVKINASGESSQPPGREFCVPDSVIFSFIFHKQILPHSFISLCSPLASYWFSYFK